MRELETLHWKYFYKSQCVRLLSRSRDSDNAHNHLNREGNRYTVSFLHKARQMQQLVRHSRLMILSSGTPLHCRTPVTYLLATQRDR